MTELRLPPPQPATPPPSVRLVAAQEPRDVLTQTGGGETAPTDAAAPADAELVATVHQLQQENAELQAYLDRVLEALATSAAESDLTHVIDDPLAPTEYQGAPKDARQAEALDRLQQQHAAQEQEEDLGHAALRRGGSAHPAAPSSPRQPR